MKCTYLYFTFSQFIALNVSFIPSFCGQLSRWLCMPFSAWSNDFTPCLYFSHAIMRKFWEFYRILKTDVCSEFLGSFLYSVHCSFLLYYTCNKYISLFMQTWAVVAEMRYFLSWTIFFCSWEFFTMFLQSLDWRLWWYRVVWYLWLSLYNSRTGSLLFSLFETLGRKKIGFNFWFLALYKFNSFTVH